MMRYELVEGSSSKFWEVAVDGDELTVRFGRIGTAGQAKTKRFADAAAADRERDKLVREKTGKGYRRVEVDADAAATSAAAPVPTPAPAVEPEPEPAAPPAARAEAAPVLPSLPPPPSTPAASNIPWPTDGFRWTDEWRTLLPTVRGIHVPPFALDPAAPDAAPQIDDQDIRWQPMHVGWRNAQVVEFATVTGRAWTPWDAATLRRETTRAALAQRDVEAWFERLAQLNIHHEFRNVSIAAGLVLHGPAFMLEVVVSLGAWLTGVGRFGDLMHFALRPLRHAIAAADDTTWQAAFDTAAALRARPEPTPAAEAAQTTRMLCAHLFPDRAEWVADALAARVDDRAGHLREGVMSPAAMAEYIGRQSMWFGYMKPALLLQVHLHGDAALPALAAALDQVLTGRESNKETVQQALTMFTAMRRPEMLMHLGLHLDNLEVRAALEKLSRKFPAAVLLTAVRRALATRSRAIEGWAVRLALREPAAVPAVMAALEPAQRERLQAMLEALSVEELPMERLPHWLRHPPWLDKQRAQALPQLALTPLASPDRIDTTAAQREQALAYRPLEYIRYATFGGRNPKLIENDDKVLDALSFNDAGIAAMRARQPIAATHFTEPWRVAYAQSLAMLEDHALALHLWNGYPQAQWRPYEDRSGITGLMLARHGTAALPGLLRHVQSNALEALPLCMKVDTLALVPTVLNALRNLKKARPLAIEWIRAHVRTTVVGAIPLAFGTDAAAAVNAQHALRWLVEDGHAETVRAVTADHAAAHGPDAATAVQAVLDADPMRVLPARMPRLPAFFVPAAFRRPALREGGALPAAALEHIGLMLAIGRPEAPYAGIERVRTVCTPDSLAEFAWDVFEAWTAAGSPSKEAWAFHALGFFGNDETARRLAPKIREWPGESAHSRAVTGLDLLALIGSDVALMHLNGIAGKVKFKALQDRAREKIAAVAEARGFTADELADRLVPDLGLDEHGTLALDFGSRRFSVGFDETLKPFVRDAQGTRLKDLPKPLRSDDGTLAAAATERFKQVKKDAKAIAAMQVQRLEMGMVARRRWPAADFRLFFAQHPLMRHIAARVVWGVYVEGGYVRGLRIAEDGTLADRDDTLFTLPDDAIVGIAHVLEMPADELAAFGQMFADYEILQPFRQLGRETFALTDAERASHETTRFASKTVATGSLLGLANRGWERGEAQDAGWVGEFVKPLPGGLEAALQLDPGTVVGEPSYEPKQKLPTLALRPRHGHDANGPRTLGELDPIVASELLRDIELLAPIKE